MRALAVGDVADQADAAESTPVGIGNAGGLKLEPAPAVVGVAEAEIALDADAGAFLRRHQGDAETLFVSRMDVLEEIIDLRRQLAGHQRQRNFDFGANLDFIAADVPFPHRRSRCSERQRAALEFRRRAGIDGIGRAESELRDREAHKDDDEDEACD